MTLKAAQELAKRRWKRTSKQERKEIASELGKASAESMTPAQRKERARAAAAARWATKKKNTANGKGK
jgi:hypothetical protein